MCQLRKSYRSPEEPEAIFSPICNTPRSISESLNFLCNSCSLSEVDKCDLPDNDGCTKDKIKNKDSAHFLVTKSIYLIKRKIIQKEMHIFSQCRLLESLEQLFSLLQVMRETVKGISSYASKISLL
jgi:hypothetical protein